MDLIDFEANIEKETYPFTIGQEKVLTAYYPNVSICGILILWILK
ncbi:hypothetical protein PilKf_01752 [Pillotina sp. SPG140]|jgi:hypothetical protein